MLTNGIQEAERDEMRRIQQEEDERIAREEASRQREYLLDEKTRQRIRNDSEELRELEHKLKVCILSFVASYNRVDIDSLYEQREGYSAGRTAHYEGKTSGKYAYQSYLSYAPY